MVRKWNLPMWQLFFLFFKNLFIDFKITKFNFCCFYFQIANFWWLMPKWKTILLFIATMASANLLGGRGPSSYRGRASVSFYTGLSRTRWRWPRSKSAWPPATKSSWRSSTIKKTVSWQFICLTANTQGKDLELGSFLSKLEDVNACHMFLQTDNCIVSK